MGNAGPGPCVRGRLQRHGSAPGRYPIILHIFHNMDGAPQSNTQLYTSNITVLADLVYNLSFWARTSADINVSRLELFGMRPPYVPVAVSSPPVLLRADLPGSGWGFYSVSHWLMCCVQALASLWLRGCCQCSATLPIASRMPCLVNAQCKRYEPPPSPIQTIQMQTARVRSRTLLCSTGSRA